MAKHYDNIEDVKAKLAGSIIYYDGIPVFCKGVDESMDQEKGTTIFYAAITSSLTTKAIILKEITDPAFNFTKFNLGYANYKPGACWWYRIPVRQYKQGLKGEQVRYHISEKAMGNPGYSLSTTGVVSDMLLNKYPTYDAVEKTLRDSEMPSITAFHKDFALSYDKVHKDLILEYKGKVIGFMDKKINLMDEYEHLYESAKEAIHG